MGLIACCSLLLVNQQDGTEVVSALPFYLSSLSSILDSTIICQIGALQARILHQKKCSVPQISMSCGLWAHHPALTSGWCWISHDVVKTSCWTMLTCWPNYKFLPSLTWKSPIPKLGLNHLSTNMKQNGRWSEFDMLEVSTTSLVCYIWYNMDIWWNIWENTNPLKRRFMSGVGCGAIWREGRNGSRACTRDKLKQGATRF